MHTENLGTDFVSQCPLIKDTRVKVRKHIFFVFFFCFVFLGSIILDLDKGSRS